MNERVHTLLLALAALATLWFVLVPKAAPERGEFARPLSTEMRPDGLAAAARWLRGSGIPVHSLRTRFRALAESREWPATGNVLLTHLPHRLPLRASERRPLEEWIARGNTLVVLAALNDTPGWSGPAVEVEPVPVALTQLAGLEIEVARADDAPTEPDVPPFGAEDPATLRYAEPRRTVLQRTLEHPLLAGVQEVVGVSDYPTDLWRARPDDEVRIVLADARFAAVAGAGDDVRTAAAGEGLWLIPRDAGRVIVVGVASAFTNRVLGTADNAVLFERIVVGSLGPDGAVLFDDAHQGASSLYTPAAFARDPRLYASVAILVALWLAWALGVQRLAAPPPAPRRPGEDVLVRGAASLYARRGGAKAAAQRMLAHFHARLGAGTRSTPDWATLAARRPEARDAIEAARALEERVHAGKNVDVRRLRRVLLEVERTLK